MPLADYLELSDAPSTSVLVRNPNASVPRAAGGGSWVYAANTIAVPGGGGGFGLYKVGVGFNPVSSGDSASVSAAMKRLPGGGPTGSAPFIFAGADATSINTRAYILGLGDADPAHIVLKKCDAAYSPAGLLSAGLPDLAPDPAANGILMRSTNTYSINTWVHLKLDWIVQADGSVLIQVFMNDIAANPLDQPPVWTSIPGMEGPQATAGDGPLTGFLDDTAQISTGTAPIDSGRLGWGGHFSDVIRRCAYDQVVMTVNP